MKYQKMTNLLDNIPNQPSKFRTKNWIGITYDARWTYNIDSQINLNTTMLKSSLFDYSDAYILAKAALRVQIWKKTFRLNNEKFSYNILKNGIIYLNLLCIYKRPIILSLFKFDTLNFIIYILTILTCPLKTYY